jgi:hypothetical protein
MAELNQTRYALLKRNQANIRQVNKILVDEALKVTALAAGFNQDQMGGFLREVIPGLIDEYGNVNAAAALEYYNDQRLAALGRNPGRAAARRQAERFARARLESEIYIASLPQFDIEAKAEPIIGYAMSMYTKNGFDSMRPELANALTRAVASFNRDTLLYNSALDRSVVGVQRVAEPNACSFCRTVAFGSRNNKYQPRITSYAPNWHNNCNCSIETIYEGDSLYRPDYYDEFEYGRPTAKQTTERNAGAEALSEADSWTQTKAAYGAGFVSA